MAQRGGSLPAWHELEVIRVNGKISVERFCARLNIPRSTWYSWRAAHLRGEARERRAAPVVDVVLLPAATTAQKWSAWGHRKIWAMLRADGIEVSQSSVYRALKAQDLLQPQRYQAEVREWPKPGGRRSSTRPTAANRVWQTDFTRVETSTGGDWWVSPIVDYVAKVCLAAPVTSTAGARDAIACLRDAIAAAEALLQTPLLHDCTDPATGEIIPVIIVTDNGPCYKSADFKRFIDSRPELTHVRTRYRSPQTNGVVERFNQSLKYEHIYRLEIPTGHELAIEVEEYRRIYNDVRPHEALAFSRPTAAYTATPGRSPAEAATPNLSGDQSAQPS